MWVGLRRFGSVGDVMGAVRWLEKRFGSIRVKEYKSVKVQETTWSG
jgi:hypothetical protein